jgi:L-ribulose-5-phosphate 3-epimerase
MNQSRRKFIQTASAISAGVAISPQIFSGSLISKTKIYPLSVFTKCLQFLDYAKLGETLGNIGFNSAELTVRSAGQVLPENVTTDLPKAIKILQESGITLI